MYIMYYTVYYSEHRSQHSVLYYNKIYELQTTLCACTKYETSFKLLPIGVNIFDIEYILKQYQCHSYKSIILIKARYNVYSILLVH